MQVKKITPESIKKAVEILKAGGVVAYPTETAYALGCDATNERGKKRIFKIKNRPKEKNLPVICATKKMAFDFFKFGKTERKFAKKYWPGALTMILSPSLILPLNKGEEGGGAAVRVSSNKIARALSRGIGRPIISTSANVSGKKTLYDVKEIINEFANKKNQPDLILDAGKLPMRKPSTIIKIVNEKIIILRQGEVKI